MFDFLLTPQQLMARSANKANAEDYVGAIVDLDKLLAKGAFPYGTAMVHRVRGSFKILSKDFEGAERDLFAALDSANLSVPSEVVQAFGVLASCYWHKGQPQYARWACRCALCYHQFVKAVIPLVGEEWADSFRKESEQAINGVLALQQTLGH